MASYFKMCARWEELSCEPLTLENAQERVRLIMWMGEDEGDDEMACYWESTFYIDVLTAVAEGHKHSRELAAVALGTVELNLHR